MLSTKCVFEYRNQFPSDKCYFGEPGSQILIENGETAFISPFNETDKIFFDRLKRSREVGRNLFYEEWDIFEYDSNYIY